MVHLCDCEYASTFCVQLGVALAKNALVLKGRKLAVVITLLLPSIVVVVLYILIVSLVASNSAYERDSVEQGVMAIGGGALIAAGTIGQAALLVNTVAMEKQSHLLSSLRLLSLWESVYWLSWWISVASIAVVGAGIALLLGYALDLRVYTQCDAWVLVLMHASYACAVTAAATVCAALFTSPMMVGLIVFVCLATTIGFAFFASLGPGVLGLLANFKYIWCTFGFALSPVYHFIGLYVDVAGHVNSGARYTWSALESADDVTQATFLLPTQSYDATPFVGWKALLYMGASWPLYLVAAWCVASLRLLGTFLCAVATASRGCLSHLHACSLSRPCLCIYDTVRVPARLAFAPASCARLCNG
jgi:hypothetical protein